MKRFVEGEARDQISLLPECVEDYVGEDNPVRVIDVFVDELDLQGMGFEGTTAAVIGRPAYHPAVLLKIYVYGYLNRVQSSRRLEHVIWVGNLGPKAAGRLYLQRRGFVVKKKRFSVEQIVAVLKQAELGMPVADLIRQRVEATPGRERPVEEAGRRAEPGQGDLAGHRCKKVAGPALRRQAVDYIVEHHGCSRRRACRLVRQHRSTQYYRSVKDRREDLRARMREIARSRVRYGYRRIHVLLRREGWKLGKHQMYRLYGEEQLQLRSRSGSRRRMGSIRTRAR